MEALEVKSVIRNYIEENVFEHQNKIKDDTLIFREGYFDSMGFVSLISFLENDFRITTLDGDIMEENFESINAIAKYVTSKI